MSILINLLVSNTWLWIVFFFGGCAFFIILLATSIYCFLEKFPQHNLYGIVIFGITIIFGVPFFTFVNICKDYEYAQIFYDNVACIENCPFDDLSDGTLNGILIKISKNPLYKEDKVVSLDSVSYKFEVENHNGQAKVVAIFKNGKEIAFPESMDENEVMGFMAVSMLTFMVFFFSAVDYHDTGRYPI